MRATMAADKLCIILALASNRFNKIGVDVFRGLRLGSRVNSGRPGRDPEPSRNQPGTTRSQLGTMPGTQAEDTRWSRVGSGWVPGGPSRFRFVWFRVCSGMVRGLRL